MFRRRIWEEGMVPGCVGKKEDESGERRGINKYDRRL